MKTHVARNAEAGRVVLNQVNGNIADVMYAIASSICFNVNLFNGTTTVELTRDENLNLHRVDVLGRPEISQVADLADLIGLAINYGFITYFQWPPVQDGIVFSVKRS